VSRGGLRRSSEATLSLARIDAQAIAGCSIDAEEREHPRREAIVAAVPKNYFAERIAKAYEAKWPPPVPSRRLLTRL
jgi:hypothetical protein